MLISKIISYPGNTRWSWRSTLFVKLFFFKSDARSSSNNILRVARRKSRPTKTIEKNWLGQHQGQKTHTVCLHFIAALKEMVQQKGNKNISVVVKRKRKKETKRKKKRKRKREKKQSSLKVPKLTAYGINWLEKIDRTCRQISCFWLARSPLRALNAIIWTQWVYECVWGPEYIYIYMCVCVCVCVDLELQFLRKSNRVKM